MTELLLSVVGGVLIGIGLVILYTVYRIRLLNATLDSYIQEALEQVKDSFVIILVEKDKDTYYCYRKEDRQFVCQGNTIAEIKTAFKLKFPNKVAVVSNETAEDIVAEFKKELDENSTSV